MTIYRKIPNQITVAEINAASFDHVRDHVLIDRFRETFNRNPEEFVAGELEVFWQDRTADDYWTADLGTWNGEYWVPAAIAGKAGTDYILMLGASGVWATGQRPTAIRFTIDPPEVVPTIYGNYSYGGYSFTAPCFQNQDADENPIGSGGTILFRWRDEDLAQLFLFSVGVDFDVLKIEIFDAGGEWIDVTAPEHWEDLGGGAVYGGGTWSEGYFYVSSTNDWYTGHHFNLVRFTFSGNLDGFYFFPIGSDSIGEGLESEEALGIHEEYGVTELYPEDYCALSDSAYNNLAVSKIELYEPVMPLSEWVEKTGESYWTPSVGSWDGEKWNSEDDGGVQRVLLAAAGTWAQNYRPAAIRLTLSDQTPWLILSDASGLHSIVYTEPYYSEDEEFCAWCGYDIDGLNIYSGVGSFSITKIEFYFRGGTWIDVTADTFWQAIESQYAEYSESVWNMKEYTPGAVYVEFWPTGTWMQDGERCKVYHFLRLTFTGLADNAIDSVSEICNDYSHVVSLQELGLGKFTIVPDQALFFVEETEAFTLTKIELYQADIGTLAPPDGSLCGGGGGGGLL